MISVSTPFSAKAQNTGLAQGGGNGEAGQAIEQAQTSNQGSSGVAGETTMFSGNNLQCQTLENSDTLISSDATCPTNNPSLTFNHEVCVNCIDSLSSPDRRIVANALGIGTTTNPVTICDALAQLGSPEAIAQRLSQGGVDPEITSYILRCIFGV